jgi:hypothetical protein
MADDFTTPPPGRRVLRDEYQGLTPEEIRQREVERIWGSEKRAAPPPVWQAPAPSPPEILALLRFAHDPQTGRPAAPPRPPPPETPGPFASDSELVAAGGRRHRALSQFLAEDDQYWQRFTFWAGLDNCQKTQLAADARFGGEQSPSWSVVCTQDPSQVPVVVKASHAAEAISRWREICGVRGFDVLADFTEPLTATPYQPPEVPNGTAGDR